MILKSFLFICAALYVIQPLFAVTSQGCAASHGTPYLGSLWPSPHGLSWPATPPPPASECQSRIAFHQNLKLLLANRMNQLTKWKKYPLRTTNPKTPAPTPMPIFSAKVKSDPHYSESVRRRRLVSNHQKLQELQMGNSFFVWTLLSWKFQKV